MNNKLKPIASSATLEGLQKLLNEYFYSTSYVIDPDTLIVSNSVGECPHITVTLSNKRYKALW